MPREDGSYAQEEVEQIKAGLQKALDEAHNAVTERDKALAEVTRTLAARDQEFASLKEAAKTATADIEARLPRLQEGLKQAAAKYRELVLQVHPDIPAELVQGDDVAAIDAAVSRGRAIVDKVKAGLEELARKNAAPPGAPPRQPPDVDSLSPTDKIKLGLRNGH